jgi:hypothetical protein
MLLFCASGFCVLSVSVAILQVKSLALAETEAAAAILGKAERLIKSLAEQRQQQRQREVRCSAAVIGCSMNREPYSDIMRLTCKTSVLRKHLWLFHDHCCLIVLLCRAQCFVKDLIQLKQALHVACLMYYLMLAYVVLSLSG